MSAEVEPVNASAARTTFVLIFDTFFLEWRDAIHSWKRKLKFSDMLTTYKSGPVARNSLFRLWS